MTQVERMLPLYEGKMGHQYDHRAASFYGVGDTDLTENQDHSFGAVVLPRNWIREGVTLQRQSRREWSSRDAFLGHRQVARNTDERTAIGTLLPFGAASYGWILTVGAELEGSALLLAIYNSYCFDYLTRQFLSQPSIPQGTFAQLAAPTADEIASLGAVTRPVDWTVTRVLRLTASNGELAHILEARGLKPIAWHPETRRLVDAELNALMFHVFGVQYAEADYMMETFPIVKRKDTAAHGEYRTKRLTLEMYDALAKAIEKGAPYESPFYDLLTEGN